MKFAYLYDVLVDGMVPGDGISRVGGKTCIWSAHKSHGYLKSTRSSSACLKAEATPLKEIHELYDKSERILNPFRGLFKGQFTTTKSNFFLLLPCWDRQRAACSDPPCNSLLQVQLTIEESMEVKSKQFMEWITDTGWKGCSFTALSIRHSRTNGLLVWAHKIFVNLKSDQLLQPKHVSLLYQVMKGSTKGKHFFLHLLRNDKWFAISGSSFWL